MFVKKVFQLVRPFLANLHSTIVLTNTHTVYVLNDPKIFKVVFWHMSIQIRRILRRFQICGNNWKKSAQKKFFAKYFCKLVVYGRGETPIFHTYFGYNFFVSKFFTFALFWYPYSNFAKKMFLCHIRKKRLIILKNVFYQSVLRL